MRDFMLRFFSSTLGNYVDKDFSSSVFLNIILRLVALPFPLLLSIFLARILGPEEFGVYSFVLAVTFLLYKPLDTSLANFSVRNLANESVKPNRLDIGMVAAFCLIMIGVVLIVYQLSFLIFLSGVNLVNAEVSRLIINMSVLLVFAMALISLVGGIQRGLGNVTIGVLPDLVLKPVMLLAVFAIYVFFLKAQSLEAREFFFLYFVVVLLVLCAALLLYYKYIGIIPKLTISAAAFWNSFGGFWPLFVMGFIQALNSYLPILFVGVLLSETDISSYKVADAIAANIGIGLLAVNVVLAPKLAASSRSGDMKRAQSILLSGSRLVLMLSIPIAILFLLFPEVLLGTLFGAKYVEAAPLLRILALGRLINAIGGPVGLTLNMLGMERETMRIMTIATVINFFLCLVLIPYLGLIGAGISTGVCFLTWNCMLLLRLYQRSGLIALPIRW